MKQPIMRLYKVSPLPLPKDAASPDAGGDTVAGVELLSLKVSPVDQRQPQRPIGPVLVGRVEVLYLRRRGEPDAVLSLVSGIEVTDEEV